VQHEAHSRLAKAPRAAEVMVDGDRFAIVTARERYEDLVRLEPAVPDWRTV